MKCAAGKWSLLFMATNMTTNMTAKKTNRWVAKVKTDSTHPPEGLFTKDAATIARTLASKKVSPKGPGSGMRMLTYFINRAGSGLSKTRRAELERAKGLLSKRVQRAKPAGRPAAA
jgi:tRNA(adenine34) deaminase